MSNKLFSEMISGFVGAKKYRAGKKAKMRISRVPFEPVSMRPAGIRRIRTRLRLSQPEFAEFLCTRVGTTTGSSLGRSLHKTSLKPVPEEKSSDSGDFLLVLLKPFPQSHVPSSTNCPLPAIDLSDFPHAIKL